jgi:hypothetical protein
MKIKTIETNTIEEFDKECNEFNESHNVKYTQSHVTYNLIRQVMLYTAILYYEDKQ